MNELSDENLMRLLVRGDASAFDALLGRHRPGVRRRLVTIVRDESAAEDLLQEVFLRLWTHAAQWSGEGSVAGWLLRIATNVALNHLRSARRRPVRPLPAAELDNEDDPTSGCLADESALDPAELLERAEALESLRRSVDALPEAKRAVMRMVHEEDMSIADVAERLGIPEGTVKSRLHYAIRRIARELGEAD